MPRGYADFARQLLIWFGFVFAYQGARGLADRNPSKAFLDGWRLAGSMEFHVENRRSRIARLGGLAVHPDFRGRRLADEAARTFDRHVLLDRSDPIQGTHCCGYIVLPTAPPRMFPSIGFIDHHSNGVVQLAANPYAAMPSLHAADALIVGLVLSALVRRRLWKVVWLVWPFWVCFAVMATGNHFWLDVLAGVALGSVAMFVVYRLPVRRLIAKRL